MNCIYISKADMSLVNEYLDGNLTSRCPKTFGLFMYEPASSRNLDNPYKLGAPTTAGVADIYNVYGQLNSLWGVLRTIIISNYSL